MGKKPRKENLAVELKSDKQPKMGRVYSNFVEMSHTPWDFTMRFCLAPTSADLPKENSKKKTIEVIAPTVIDVLVPPILVPAIISALQTNYKRYAETYLSEERAEENAGTKENDEPGQTQD